MFVKNYYALLNHGIGGGYSADVMPATFANGVVMANITYYSMALKTIMNRVTSNSITANYSGSTPEYSVFFGSGNTKVSYDDYTLSGEQVTNLAATISIAVDTDSDGQTVTGTYTITNNASDAQTIREVCLCAGVYNGNYNSYVMVERTVLDEPITIPAGGVGRVVYTIRVNYPTA